MEVHTPTNPYCTDPYCWCHTDVLYHNRVLQAPVPADGQLAQAYAFFGIVDEGTHTDAGGWLLDGRTWDEMPARWEVG